MDFIVKKEEFIYFSTNSKSFFSSLNICWVFICVLMINADNLSCVNGKKTKLCFSPLFLTLLTIFNENNFNMKTHCIKADILDHVIS